jgi:ribosomal protein S18 acetylase RimI-like enzyme
VNIHIRRPSSSDADAVAGISLLCCAAFREEAHVWNAAANGPRAEKGYWLAEVSPRCAPSSRLVVGYGRFERERPRIAGARVYRLYLGVHPGYRRAGIGSALLNRMTRELAAIGAESLHARTRADQSETIDFLASRGFKEYERKIHFALDLTRLDSASFSATCRQSQDQMVAAGVSILNLVDYSKKEPDWLPKLLIIYNRLGADVPDADPYQPITQDAFGRFVADPDLPHACFFVATADTELVGYSYLLVAAGKDEAIVAMTGVLPEHRRRGIATALKVHGMQYALSAGIRTMVTSASGINAASIAVNERLGFRQTHAEVRLEKLSWTG